MSAKRTSDGTVAASRVAKLLGVTTRSVQRACARSIEGYRGNGMVIPAVQCGRVYRVPRWWYERAERVLKPGSAAAAARFI